MYRWFLIGITMAGLTGCLTFTVTYAIRSRGAWRYSDAGRFLMVGQANLGTLFALILTNQLLGTDWPGRELITVLLFSAYTAETWWPLRLLIRVGRRRREGAKDIVGTRVSEYDD